MQSFLLAKDIWHCKDGYFIQLFVFSLKSLIRVNLALSLLQVSGFSYVIYMGCVTLLIKFLYNFTGLMQSVHQYEKDSRVNKLGCIHGAHPWTCTIPYSWGRKKFKKFAEICAQLAQAVLQFLWKKKNL